jgi:hypothetical protein
VQSLARKYVIRVGLQMRSAIADLPASSLMTAIRARTGIPLLVCRRIRTRTRRALGQRELK